MRNHGNLIVSLSELGRFLGEQAEAVGATILPETAGDEAARRPRPRRRRPHRRQGPRARQGEPLANFEPGIDVAARLTVLAEGTAGHLTTAAIDHFGLARARTRRSGRSA